jgi:hypothetical protein
MTCKPVLNRGFLRGKTGLHDLRFISLLSLEIQFSKGGPLNLFSCLSHIMTYISNAIGLDFFQVRVITFSQFSGCWLILSVYVIMSFDLPFVRLFGVR